MLRCDIPSVPPRAFAKAPIGDFGNPAAQAGVTGITVSAADHRPHTGVVHRTTASRALVGLSRLADSLVESERRVG